MNKSACLAPTTTCEPEVNVRFLLSPVGADLEGLALSSRCNVNVAFTYPPCENLVFSSHKKVDVHQSNWVYIDFYSFIAPRQPFLEHCLATYYKN